MLHRGVALTTVHVIPERSFQQELHAGVPLQVAQSTATLAKMKYYLIRVQAGQGCDYTIGCGLNVSHLRAKNKEDAIKEVIGLPDDWKESFSKDWEDYMYDTGYLGDAEDDMERQIESVDLLEVNEEIDMMPILKAKLAEVKGHFQSLQDQKDLKAKEARDLAEFERLKKKFKK